MTSTKYIRMDVHTESISIAVRRLSVCQDFPTRDCLNTTRKFNPEYRENDIQYDQVCHRLFNTFLTGGCGVVVLGGAAHYWGLSGRTLFVLVTAAIFLAAAPLPWRKRKGWEERDESVQLKTAPRIRGSRRHDRAGSSVDAFRPK